MNPKKELTLEKAIALGEYHPEVLKQFKEFNILSPYSQFQIIRRALKIREHQLRIHWAEIVNQLNFSKKPYLKQALENIEKQIDQLNEDEEALLIQYSK